MQQGLEDGAQGSGNQAGQYTDKSRKLNEEQSRHKKQIRQQLRQKLQSKDFKHVTASEVLEILREKIKSKMLTSNSELNAHRIFAHAAGLDGGSTQTNFNFQTFQQGFRKLGLSDIPNDTLKLVFQALDINNDGKYSKRRERASRNGSTVDFNFYAVSLFSNLFQLSLSCSSFF